MRAPIRVRRMAASASRARRTARLAGLCFRMHPAEPPRSSAAWSSVPVIPDAGSRPGSLVRVGAPSAAEELSRGNFHIGLSLAPPVDSFMGRSACGHTNTKARRVTPSPEGPPMLPNTFARRIVLRGEADRFTLRARSLLSIVAGVAAGVSLACGGESLGSGAGDAGAKPSSSGGSQGSSGSEGGQGSSGGSSSGSESPPSTLDASTLPTDPSCPSAPPSNASACSNEALQCEYGTDENLQCDTFARCENQVWVVTIPPGAGATCPTPQPGASGCPSAPPAMGTTCSAGASCAYPPGLCACTAPSPYQSGYEWACEQPGTDCPQPRPGAGSACSAMGLICQYGVCDSSDAPEVFTCMGEEWVVSPGTCGD